VQEIPLAPVLDLLTVVIFFLLLSTSFVELTKQTLPPSSTSVVSDPAAPIPLNLRLFLVRAGKAYKFALQWAGDKPGREERLLPAGALGAAREKDLREVSANLAHELKQRYPQEASVQVGLGSNINYQEVIAVMDGVREHFDDLVMVSPQDAESKER
jgi:biopolymer transport protein ExbD